MPTPLPERVGASNSKNSLPNQRKYCPLCLPIKISGNFCLACSCWLCNKPAWRISISFAKRAEPCNSRLGLPKITASKTTITGKKPNRADSTVETTKGTNMVSGSLFICQYFSNKNGLGSVFLSESQSTKTVAPK